MGFSVQASERACAIETDQSPFNKSTSLMVKFLILLAIIFGTTIIVRTIEPIIEAHETTQDLKKMQEEAKNLSFRMSAYKSNFNTYNSSLITPELSPCDRRTTQPSTKHYKINCRIEAHDAYQIDIVGIGAQVGYKESLSYR